MKRNLVLVSEGAGHPFRRMLPPASIALALPDAPKPLKWWQQEDTHLFVVSFGAFFTVFYTFIA